ncbi:MAG: hypothetical protein HFJ54_08695 [Clostridia bacterium]|nr:hypothetical protein [Clostridia bacterium]
MRIENTIKIFKEIHPESVILIKMGTFYHAYGRDSYILSYLFNYQIKKVQSNYSTCGFPDSGLNKVLSKLEEMEISYLILNKSDNYQVIEEEDFRVKNNYNEVYNKAYNYVSKKNRIDGIYQFLIESIAEEKIKEKIIRIEEIVYETR